MWKKKKVEGRLETRKKQSITIFKIQKGSMEREGVARIRRNQTSGWNRGA